MERQQSRQLLLRLEVVVVIGAAALAGAAAFYDRLPGDLALTRAVQDWPLPSLLSRTVRTFGDIRLLLPLGGLMAVVAWISGSRRFSIIIVVGLIALQPYQFLIKETADRPRPSTSLVDVRGNATSPSFPAGHVLSPTVVGGLIFYALVRRRASWRDYRAASLLAGGFLILAGIVNIHLGVHWPSDVVGGYLWGLALLLPAIAVNVSALGEKALEP